MKLFIKNCLKKTEYFVKRFSSALIIRRIAQQFPKLEFNKKVLQEHLALWGQLHRIVDPAWYKVYATASGINDAKFVPADTFLYIIEPKLNDRDLTDSYQDKNMYDHLWGSKFFPLTLVRNIHGLLYDQSYQRLTTALENYLANEIKIIVKPSLNTGGGRNIGVFEKKDQKLINIFDGEEFGQNYLDLKYGKNFVIQRFIDQHPYFLQFNKTSLNTIRITTYRSVVSEDVVVLCLGGGILRFGNLHAIKDNWSSGGQACYINRSGKLNPFAINNLGKKIATLSDGRDISSLPVVHKFQEAKEMACELAKKFLYFRILAFDICVNAQDELRIIEVNPSYIGTEAYQMQSGSIFGEYTDEVINYCLHNN